MRQVAMTGLLKIELPGHTLRFCDGGFIEFEGELYRSRDAVFGTIGAVQSLVEGVGDSVPALNLTFLPPTATAASTLSQPGNQTARVRFWLAEYDPETGTIMSADVQFDGQIDQSVLTIRKGGRELAMTIVALIERLFEGNIGNTLNPTWHKSVWPGETGHDNATGLTTQVAWGVDAPPSGGGRGGGAGGGFARSMGFANLRQY